MSFIDSTNMKSCRKRNSESEEYDGAWSTGEGSEDENERSEDESDVLQRSHSTNII